MSEVLNQKFWSLLVLVFVLANHAAFGQEEEKWQYDLSASLWTGNTGVEVLPQGATDPVKIELPDFLDNFQLGLVLRGEARLRKLGVMLDVGYIELTASDQPASPDIDRISVDVNSTLINLSGIFRLHGGDIVTLEALPGVQFYNGNSDITTSGTVSGVSSTSRSFWDPILGLRARARVFGKLHASAYGNIGGFGASSQTTSQLALGLRYRLLEIVSVHAGYRLVKWEFDEGAEDILRSQRISGLTFGLMLTL